MRERLEDYDDEYEYPEDYLEEQEPVEEMERASEENLDEDSIEDRVEVEPTYQEIEEVEVPEPDPEMEDMRKLSETDMETNGIDWLEDIRGIDDPKLRDKEMEAAREILESEEKLRERRESGEVHEMDYDRHYNDEVMAPKRRALVRCAYQKLGLSPEEREDIFDRWDDTDMPFGARQIREGRLRHAVEELGLEGVTELKDRLLRERKITDEANSDISDLLGRWGK